jgi:dolichol-phosphate mannosyltransferase|tara:strand:- start:696 stop:1385 length:690 start_codon:yes stop_codon:yes gene_type:complete
MRSVTIIVPVKDEEVGLQYLLEDFRDSDLKEDNDIKFIFVIDDRSSDASQRFASEFTDIIIDQKETTGKGAAVKQAIEYWKNEPTEMTIFLDADGSYSFSSVSKILSKLSEGSDVVSGSRFLSKGGRPEGMSRLHTFGNKFLSKISSIRNRRKITDLCTGLWGFSEKALMKLEIQSKGFDLEAEIAGMARKNGFHHHEVEVEWNQRKGGISKLRSLTDGFIIFSRIIRT